MEAKTGRIMRTYLAIGALWLACGAAHATVNLTGAKPPPAQERVHFASGCKTDDEIAADQRQVIDAAAMAYVHLLLAGNADETFRSMTAFVRADTTYQKEMQSVTDAVRGAIFSNLKIDHTYLVEPVGSGHDVYSACGDSANHVTVGTKFGWTQAHVQISAKSGGNDWGFTLWLMREDSGWHVQYFHLGAITIVGRGPEELLAMAREQDRRGHAFNATMLYAGADFVANRGTSLGLAIRRTLNEEMTKFKEPPEFDGGPPFTWTLDGTAYKIEKVTISGEAGQMGLVFTLSPAAWKDEAEAEKRNHAFLDAFRAVHPEFAEIFEFLNARAQSATGTEVHSTIYDTKNGYR